MLKTPIRNHIVYTARKISNKRQKVQTLIRRRDRGAAAGLCLHFLQMSEGPFSHDAGHLLVFGFLVD